MVAFLCRLFDIGLADLAVAVKDNRIFRSLDGNRIVDVKELPIFTKVT
jgi:hypothetical protein